MIFLLINKRVWCVPCVIVFYKRPRNHIQMSGPEYEESEINEITKLTRRAHGTGSAVRARAILGQRDIRCSLHFRGPAECQVRYAGQILQHCDSIYRRSNGAGRFLIRPSSPTIGPCFSRLRESKEQKSFFCKSTRVGLLRNNISKLRMIRELYDGE